MIGGTVVGVMAIALLSLFLMAQNKGRIARVNIIITCDLVRYGPTPANSRLRHLQQP